MTQQRRLVLAVAVGLVPLLALVAAVVWRSVSDTEAQIVREREALARAAALVVDVYVRDNVAALETLAQDRAATDDRDPPAVSRYLADIAQRNPNWDGVGLVDGRGLNVTVTATTPLRSVSIADRDYFKEAMGTGQTAISQAVIGRFSGKPTVAIAVPVSLASGDRGILTGVLSLAFLEDELDDLPAAVEIGVIVVDRSGHAVVHPDPQVVSRLADLSALPGVGAAISGGSGSLRRIEDGEALLVAYAPADVPGWGVVVRQPESAAFALIRSEALTAGSLSLFGALIVLAAAAVVGGRLQRYNDEAVERRRALERLIEQREEFLSSLGHELKTPLTSVAMAAELIGRVARRSGDDKVRHYADVMGQQLARAQGLIGQLLDISRFDQRVPLRKEPVDLGALARAVVERERAVLPPEPSREIALVADDGVVVDGDEARLEQVLINLLSNAVKYSPEGGRIDVRVAREASRATVVVIDGGIGMAPEDRELMFTPFFRGKVATARGIDGTGLGLHISKRVVEAHGGRISAASVPGHGTTVAIDLPLGVGAPEPLSVAAS